MSTQQDSGCHRAELGEFLRSRRGRLRPADVGLPDFGRRRVPGLRREELAQLAGVSADYYVRFEQGRAENVSCAVVDAVSGALRLGRDEHDHLHRLVRAAGRRGTAPAAAPAPQTVRPGLRRLLESIPDTPAFVVGLRTDVLAWNPLAAALLTDFGALPPGRRNKAWLLFCHDELRARYANWPAKAADLVAYLRMQRVRHPDDPAFCELIAELGDAHPEFREMWDKHEVRDKSHGRYLVRHPEVGELVLAFESLRLPDDPDQTLVTYTAEAGSPSEAALRLLSARVHGGVRAPVG